MRNYGVEGGTDRVGFRTQLDALQQLAHRSCLVSLCRDCFLRLFFEFYSVVPIVLSRSLHLEPGRGGGDTMRGGGSVNREPGSYIYIYICMYVCMYVCMYIYIYIYIKYVCMYVCMYVCRYNYLFVQTHTHTHTQIYTYIYIYVCVDIYIYMNT